MRDMVFDPPLELRAVFWVRVPGPMAPDGRPYVPYTARTDVRVVTIGTMR
jgi:hypothetical protein